MGFYSQEGLKNKLDKLDAHHDTMFNVGHLSTLCTPDQKMAQRIKSCLHLMEALEKEMVPGMLTYYYLIVTSIMIDLTSLNKYLWFHSCGPHVQMLQRLCQWGWRIRFVRCRIEAL